MFGGGRVQREMHLSTGLIRAFDGFLAVSCGSPRVVRRRRFSKQRDDREASAYTFRFAAFRPVAVSPSDRNWHLAPRQNVADIVAVVTDHKSRWRQFPSKKHKATNRGKAAWHLVARPVQAVWHLEKARYYDRLEYSERAHFQTKVDSIGPRSTECGRQALGHSDWMRKLPAGSPVFSIVNLLHARVCREAKYRPDLRALYNSLLAKPLKVSKNSLPIPAPALRLSIRGLGILWQNRL